MTEQERMLSGALYNPYKTDIAGWERCKTALEAFNALSWKDADRGKAILKSVFGHLEEDAIIIPPFYCDRGSQIYIGKHFYANTGLLILDEAPVRIGNDVFIAPRVSIYTAAHPLDASVRRTELEYAQGVTIGNDVWIGGNVVINPGVTIGSNVVIGSGSVVTKDIPSGVIAAGNPCRVLRPLTADDKNTWSQQLEDYRRDPDVAL